MFRIIILSERIRHIPKSASDPVGINPKQVFNPFPQFNPNSYELKKIEICPWRKFRIEIHSESIRNFPNHSEICIRTKQFHSDLIRS